jgi:nucleoside phosphorylase
MAGVLIVAATRHELCGYEGFVCGIGPVDAAASVAAELMRRRPVAVLHVGIAGARRDSGIPVGAIVVGSEAVYEDRPPALHLGTRSVAADPALVALIAACLGAEPTVIGTSAAVGGTRECAVEAMEGFAVLRACELVGVPAVEVRSISNHVEDARGDWRVDEALDALCRMLPALVDALERA